MAAITDHGAPRAGWRRTLSRAARAATARRVIGVLIAVAVTAAIFYAFGTRESRALRTLESGLNDALRVVLSPLSEAQDPRLTVLTITEDTLALFPYRSPVDRGFLAQLIDVLAESDVKAIGLDILIDQPTEPEKDEALIDAIRRYDGPLVLAWADARAGLRPQQEQFLYNFTVKSGAIPGFATVTYDDDRVVRRFDTTLDFNTWRYPLSFPGAMLRRTGVPLIPPRGLIDWRRETAEGPAFQTIPAQVLLNPAMPKAMFRNWVGGRYVLIGADLEQTDRHLTSLAADPTIPNPTSAGVLLHAHVMSQILDRRVVDDFQISRPRGFAVVLAMILLGTVIGISPISLFVKILALGTGVVGYGALALALAGIGGPYLPIAPSLLGLGVAFGLGAAAEAFVSNREKAFIRQAFSHYLEPAMVDRLAKDRDSLRLGGERRSISFLFSDIAGFTDMSEKLEPEVLAELLNEYFDGISDIIGDHNGSIDKFIGDAVVALFGALTTEPEHSLNAIRCAAAMDAFAEAFRESKAHLGLGVTRIGVHTGEASVGNFGGRKRFDYTAMGDAMNTAARLESINKRLGTRVTVSAAARAAALKWETPERPLPVLRPVGEVMLKGKAEPVPVFNLDRTTPETERAAYAEAYALLQSGDPRAQAGFAALDADDPLARLHRARLEAGETGLRIT